MNHKPEDVKAAEEHIKSSLFADSPLHTFLAGCEHKQKDHHKDIDNIISAIEYAVSIDAVGSFQLSPITKKWFKRSNPKT